MLSDADSKAPEGRGRGEVAEPSTEDLRAFWDVPSRIALVVGPDYRVRSANHASAKAGGWDHAAMSGRTLREIMPFAWDIVEPAVDRVIASGAPVSGTVKPVDFAELTLDALPIAFGSDDPRVLIVASDPQHIPFTSLEGAVSTRQAYFENLRRLACASGEDSAAVIVDALRFVVETFRLTRAFVRVLTDDEAWFRTEYEYHRPEDAPVSPREVTVESIAWANEKFLRGELIVLSSPDELPAEAKGFRDALERVGVRATVTVPIVEGRRLLGYLAYPAPEGRVWSQLNVTRLRLLGEVIGAVLVRNRAEADLRDRSRFEEQLAAAAMRFVGLAPEAVDAEIERTLEAAGACCRLDRALVTLLDNEGEALSITHEWRGPGVPSIRALFQGRRVEELSPLVRRALEGEDVAGREEDAEPGSAMAELLRAMSVHGFVMAPLHIDGRVGGLLTVQTRSHHRLDPPAYVARFKLIADVIAAGLSERASRERVRRWERRFAQIVESAMDGVVLVDASGTVKDWNGQTAAIFGLDRGEMIGRSLASVIDEGDHAALAAQIAAATRAGHAASRFELRGRRETGQIVPIEVSMTRLEQAEGGVIALFLRDITDRKRIEAEKQQAFEAALREKQRLERERDYLREERGAAEILGESPAIRGAVELVDAVAGTMSSVLLLGESGVGKEVFAAAVHARSRRRDGPFVKVNCASVPATLFESEFFGHARGSFTGAVKDRAGRFELADKGTLFLDEVGEIPIDLQAKLLRVLQEGEIERVGEDRTRRVDVRIIAATNRDLSEEVKMGRFRRDLYYRLGVFPIAIPPLRDRGKDVVLLARHFLRRHAADARRLGLELSLDDEARLMSYEWPGNVRELGHVVQRAVILSPAPPLRLDLALPYRGVPSMGSATDLLREDDLRRIERENLTLAMKKAGGRISGSGGAADLLGMHPSTLRDRLKSFGVSRID